MMDDELRCDGDCMACAGEVCMRHDGPCDCDTAQRHTDEDGGHYIGSHDGMFRVMARCDREATDGD